MVETLEDVVTLALVMAVQLGMPVSLLFVFGYLTYRNDRRRQTLPGFPGDWREAQQRPMRLGDRPCWKAKGCAAEKRAECPAFSHPEIPCWQAMKLSLGRLQAPCLDCERFVALPSHDRADGERRRRSWVR